MALLWVKLHAGDLAAADHGGKLLTVVAEGQGIRRRFADYPVRMHEIEAAVRGQVVRQRVIRRDPSDPVPAHMGNAQTRVLGEASGVLSDQSWSRQCTLLAPVRQH